MSDIVTTKVRNPYQIVTVMAGDDYVALEVDYQDPGADKCSQPDTVVLLAPAQAERLAYGLCSAALKARELAAFIASATIGGS
ncbi:hypothetical protein [Mycobacterium kansasii]|uniref:hypothetical protein n=1 Tax=Mycobacterium kansasii TaxID=1768 RepID=UPI0015E20082|nr:hypothetical protein [Mycobacterium kansasii]